MSFESIHLARPWALGLLALIVPYVLLRYRIIKKSAMAYAPVQYHRGPRGGRVALYGSLALEALILCLLFSALAGPYTESEREIIKEEGIDVALALDVSASMQAADFPPNRLEALKRIAADFVKRSGGNRIAVYVFARDVFTQTPLTTDHSVLLDLLGGISFGIISHTRGGSGGTAIGDALLAAAEGLLRNRVRGRDQVIILVTDGENNCGIDPLLAARFVRTKNIRFHVIGLGGDKPVQVFVGGRPFITVLGKPLMTSLDDTRLRQITVTAGGRYFRAKNAGVLANIFAELSRLERSPLEVETFHVRKYYASWLALPLIVVFLVWLLLRGFVLRRPLG